MGKKVSSRHSLRSRRFFIHTCSITLQCFFCVDYCTDEFRPQQMTLPPVSVRICHNFEHLDSGVGILNHDSPPGQLPIERLFRLCQRMFFALLDRYQTPGIIVLNTLITTVRQNQNRQTRCQDQQTCLAQREVVDAARCFVNIVNHIAVGDNLGLDRVPFFLAGIPLFVVFVLEPNNSFLGRSIGCSVTSTATVLSVPSCKACLPGN